jgi:phosphatidylinositol alpha-1,6-mannosyltransferase
VSKTLAHAFFLLSKDEKPVIEAFQMLSLYDQKADHRYLPKRKFRGLRGNKLYFGWHCLVSGYSATTLVLNHINLLLFAAILKVVRPRLRIILIAHGSEVNRNLGCWNKFFIRHFIRIWAVSLYTSQILVQKHQFEPRQINILHNCLDPFFIPPIHFEKSASLLTKHQLTLKHPIIFSLCRISSYDQEKGYDTVIRCMPELLKKHPGLSFLLAGEIQDLERARLTGLIADLQVQANVILLDTIPIAQLIHYYLLADVFVLPSKKEGFGLVFIEAAACGLPIVAGNLDGSRDALLNGALGTLINPDDPLALIKAISNYLDHSAILVDRYALQHSCMEHFSFQQYCINIKALLS